MCSLGLKSDFYQRVYQVVEQIPPGRICSYGAIARYLGSARSARLVGTALRQSADLLGIPAHRVVNRAGRLTGQHMFGPGVMQALLESEGLPVVNDQVVAAEKYFWDPREHLPPPKI